MRSIKFLAGVICLFSLSAGAVEQNYAFDDQNKQVVFKELTQELRCPKCQNQNIADSNAMVAIDLKNKTYELVQQGKSKQDVIDFMVERYGQFVHYDPPLNMLTIWLWIVPGMIFFALLFFMFKRNKEANPQIDDDYIKQAEQVLKQLESAQHKPSTNPVNKIKRFNLD
ncbi:cytochrome c-type biogenesis protein CcmH [Catenovulum sp. 2E275]|uniref:cytochrome c-type biogenesis protein n=1 Tax=Catenovulum sp. 2E275 TaxID=2980497 RepID=UPI0021D3D640|nr:cytochrome c-type biogenesis protein [Catenovulum sp. 2E275]MCU4675784.1 cytochrome c-type biogenesis protein CcmH [Catenovulum sp. 2E275]